MEKRMKVGGMKCMHCKANVEKSLKSVDGVADAEVDLETGIVRIVLERDVSDSLLMDAVKEKGFEPVQMI